jgi:hypothetical protein
LQARSAASAAIFSADETRAKFGDFALGFGWPEFR